MNKKAALGAQMMVFLYLLIIILIAGGITRGIAMFFGEEYDFRETDASLLNQKIYNCLSEKNINLNINLTEKEKFEQEFYSTCQIDKNVIESTFFLSLTFNSQDYKIGSGDATQCALAYENPNYPKCITSTLTKDNTIITIQTGSNQKSVKKRI